MGTLPASDEFLMLVVLFGVGGALIVITLAFTAIRARAYRASDRKDQPPSRGG